MKITEYDESLIVTNITHAKDKKKQLTIEAQLNAISKEQVKEILKKHGVSLKIFNGGSQKKKKGGIEVGLGEDNKGESWTPAEAEAAEQDIITPVEEIEAVEEQVEAAEEQVEASAAETQQGEPASCDDVLFVGLQILEEAAVFDAIKEKINKVLARRRGLVAELGHIDVLLKRYAFFYEDIYQDLQEEGIEL